MSFRFHTRLYAPVFACLLMTACAAVDQFGTRIDDANANSQDAANRETLLNIVRASQFQPLNFIAVTQVSGGQTESVTTGLPTVSIGPAQTAANHVYQISNSVNSQATGSFQSNPLVSTQFTTGMLAPIPLTTIAYLTAAHPREPVLHTTIEAIVIRLDNGKIYRFRNIKSSSEITEVCLKQIVGSQHKLSADNCNYTLFVDVLSILIEKGFTAELVPDTAAKAAAPKVKDAAGDKADDKGAARSAKGRFCFDPTRANVKLQTPVCGNYDQNAKAVPDAPLRVELPGIGMASVTIIARSPFGAYRAIGDMSRDRSPWLFYLSTEAQNLVQDHNEPFVNISADSSGGCFTWILYESQNYCVPRYSRHTALLFNILQQLKNLSTSPSDLNAAFSVRLVSN